MHKQVFIRFVISCFERKRLNAITSRTNRKDLPTHVAVKAPTGGLFADSVIMLEQMRTLDKSRLRQYIGHVDEDTMARIEEAAKTSLGITE